MGKCSRPCGLARRSGVTFLGFSGGAVLRLRTAETGISPDRPKRRRLGIEEAETRRSSRPAFETRNCRLYTLFTKLVIVENTNLDDTKRDSGFALAQES